MQSKDKTKEILELRARNTSIRDIAKIVGLSPSKVHRMLAQPEIADTLHEARMRVETAQVESLHYTLAKKIISTLSETMEDIDKKKQMALDLCNKASSETVKVQAMNLWTRLETLRLSAVKNIYDILSLEASGGTLESKLESTKDSTELVQVVFES